MVSPSLSFVMRSLLLLFFLGILSPLMSQRVALVVGTDRYDHLDERGQLKLAVRDGDLMTKTLRGLSPAFEVTPLKDPTRKEWSEALEKFVAKAQKAECALVYVAGHGVEFHGSNYLLCRDTKVSKLGANVRRMKERLHYSALPLEKIIQDLEDTEAHLKLIILDACRDNPLEVEAGNGTRSLVGSKGGLGKVTAPSGMLISYSADAGQQANDGLFTPVLAKHLQTKGQSLMRVFATTRVDVEKQSKELAARDQGIVHEPAEYSKLTPGGLDFQFAPGGAPSPPPVENVTPATATKQKPFVNSLGMKFVPAGTKGVLFSIYETRRQDYEAFASETAGLNDSWKNPEFASKKLPTERSHPVVNVNYEEALAFAAWLTRKDRAARLIGPGDKYRLPRDREWSAAVGLPREDGATPAERDKKVRNHYPWGTAWPPPRGAGNFADQSAKAVFDSFSLIENYQDGYAMTAPVGRFTANAFGVYDLGGNVWEWCEDWFDADQDSRVLRGGSWLDNNASRLLSSCRYSFRPENRYAVSGFRVVMELSGG